MKTAQHCNVRFDVASAIDQGHRPYQEDALAADFPIGSPIGFVVLSDGMGGHAAGDIASKIIVTEVFSELKLQSGTPDTFLENLPDILRDAAHAANNCVRGHAMSHPDTGGMGATLVAPVIVNDSLFWISIGDSPLYLFRDGELRQLNEDHSMAPQIDFMARSGMMQAEIAKNHPDRNCLTSVLFGEDIPKIDCPQTPLRLADNDLLIVASDGLQFLENDQIAETLIQNAHASCSEIASQLLQQLDTLDDPEQDNVSFSIVRIHHYEPAEKKGLENDKRIGTRIWPWPRAAAASQEAPADQVASG